MMKFGFLGKVRVIMTLTLLLTWHCISITHVYHTGRSQAGYADARGWMAGTAITHV